MTDSDWAVASGGNDVHIDPSKTTVEDFERLCAIAFDLKENIKDTKPEGRLAKNFFSKATTDWKVASWRSRGRSRGARAVKVDGGYAVYVRG